MNGKMTEQERISMLEVLKAKEEARTLPGIGPNIAPNRLFSKTLRPADLPVSRGKIDPSSDISGKTDRSNGIITGLDTSFLENTNSSVDKYPELNTEICNDILTEITGVYTEGRFSSSNVPSVVTGESISYRVDAQLPPKPTEIPMDEPLVAGEGLKEIAPIKRLKIAIDEDRHRRNKKEVKKNWFEQKKEAVTGKLLALKNAVGNWFEKKAQPFLRKYIQPLALAAGMASVAGTFGLTDSSASKQLRDDNVATSDAKNANVEEPIEVKLKPIGSLDENVKSTEQVRTIKTVGVQNTPKVAEILVQSKSPLVQQILKDKKLTLGNQSINDSMVGAMRGLANDSQKLQIAELEKQINLSLSVYFNEHFGTPEKVAESLKDAKLKNLYRTAKAAYQKGWVAASQTRENFPQAYEFGKQILADSAELGHDESDNADPAVKAFINGNMFQAKQPGSTINLMKNNGRYHIVVEYMLGIFEGKEVKNMSPAGVNQENDLDQKLEELNKEVQRLENLITPINPGNNLDRVGQNVILPSIAPASEGLNNQVDDVDSGWDELIEKAAQVNISKAELEKTGVVEIQIAEGLTKREEDALVLPELAKEIAKMYPGSETEISKMIRQYGFIGLKKYERVGSGKLKIELQQNFWKILKPQLKKSAV